MTIAAMAAVLGMTACGSIESNPKLDSSCKFEREYFEPRGDSEVRISVYRCEKGEVEIGR